MKKTIPYLYFFIFLYANNIHATDSAESVFTHIYQTNAWGNKESVSGPGSTLKETSKIRKEIPALLKTLGIKRILDAPCGDFNWLKEIDLSFLQLYIGVDIVEEIIELNNEQYSNIRRKFLHKNILTDSLPQADIIMCRDCLVHFPIKDIWQALNNFKKTGARYLLTTTFTGCALNKDMPKVGGWRPLNLELAPFNFPKPLVCIQEEIHYNNPVYVTKSLALWELKDL